MAANTAPAGDPIRKNGTTLEVPGRPIIPYIPGDGIGPDIWRAAQRVFDAAVSKAYGGKRQIAWYKVLAGEESFNASGTWLPDETVEAFQQYIVGIKGPLTTPVGGGIRSLNVALRQLLDLYVCLRPVRYFPGVPSPVKRPEAVDMVIFRENTEDIYAGIEWPAGSPEAGMVMEFLQREFPREFKKIRFGTPAATSEWAGHYDPDLSDRPVAVGLGLKPVSTIGSLRLIHAAITYALREKRKSVTLVHKGNIMKFTEGAFKEVGYTCAAKYFRNDTVTEREAWVLGNRDAAIAKGGDLAAEANAKMIEPGFERMTPEQRGKIVAEVEAALKLWPTHGDGKWKQKLLIKDAIADIALQQVLTRAESFDVIATLNLNGDYLSDALAAQVGGIGIAPGGNINYITSHAIFEATHGTAPKYAGQDIVNPGSLVLSGEMMFRHLGWGEAADLIIKGMEGAIAAGTVTYDFHRLMAMEGRPATKLKCSEFAEAIVKHMG